MVKVSVIMPSLNMADYIEDSITSVLAQDLDDMEILCIDAGSTDGTVNIIRRYEAFDTRVRLIHSPLKSYGYQVNLGIRQAQGDYIGIVETDDRVCPGMLSGMYDAAVKYDLDSVRCNFYFCEHLGDRMISRPCRPLADAGYADLYGQVICPSDYPELLDTDWPIWTGIVRRELLTERGIWCNESPGAAYQDLGFSVELYAESERALYLDQFYYLYTFDRAGSSIRQNKSMLQVAGEYQRLYEDKVIAAERFEKVKRTLDWKMLVSFVGMTRLVLPMADYDIHSPLFSVPYRWFSQQISREFEGDYSDNICRISDDIITKAEVLLADVPAYAVQLKEEEQKSAQNRQILADSIRRKNGKAVIFGCGIRGGRLLDCLSLIEHDTDIKVLVDAATDNDMRLWGGTFCGIDIIAPELAVHRYGGDIFIVANKYHDKDIRHQLQCLGIGEDSIIVFEP